MGKCLLILLDCLYLVAVSVVVWDCWFSVC